MGRKGILGLLLFGCLVIAGLFYGTSILIKYGADTGSSQDLTESVQDDGKEDDQVTLQDDDTADQSSSETEALPDRTIEDANEEPWFFESQADNITLDTGALSETAEAGQEGNGQAGDSGDSTIGDAGEDGTAATAAGEDNLLAGTGGGAGDSISGNGDSGEDSAEEEPEAVEVSGSADTGLASGEVERLDLIYDCSLVDYEAYIPAMIYDSSLEAALDITNPEIYLDARAAILFDVNTKEVLYYKNPVAAVFPASTAKLLTALVVLDWCREDEEVTIGNEIRMIAPDSTRAYIAEGQVLTVRNLLEGMLIPSGNDAAYALATYVGRKSLKREGASELEAVEEFVRLMNVEAKNIGTINSCFKTPDGYDAIGQYTTAYDMGLIGLAAAENSTILKITKMSNSRNVFVSGEDITWESTNALIDRYGGRYYSYCIGLKTGTSTMAGRCLISVGKKDGKEVICVIMDSTVQGRWDDTVKLLDYGLH